MSSHNNHHLSYDRAFQIFKAKEVELPERIRWKLNQICSILKGQIVQKNLNLSQQDQFQMDDLKDLNEKSLKIIFTSLIFTLFKEEIAIAKSCLIRRKGFFKFWKNGYIKYDEYFLYFNCQNKNYRYRWANIDIQVCSASKRAFDVFYKGDLYMTIKLSTQKLMLTMFKTLRQQMQKRSKQYELQINHQDYLTNFDSNILRDKSQVPLKKPLSFKRQVKKEQKNVGKQNIDTANLGILIKNKNCKKIQFQKSLISQNLAQQLIIRKSSDRKFKRPGFSLSPLQEYYSIKNQSKNCVIAVHQKDCRLILELIIDKLYENISTNHIFSSLAIYKKWNSHIINQQIMFHMKSKQKAIIYRVYEKGTTFLSQPRETYTILQYKRINSYSGVLVEQTLDNQDKQKQFTRAYLKTIFYLQIKNNKAKLTLQSLYDPRGFCSNSEACQLIYRMYKDLIHFQNYLNEYNITNKQFDEDQIFTNVPNQRIKTYEQQIFNQLNCQVSRTIKISKQESDDEQLNMQEQFKISQQKLSFMILRPISPIQIPTHQYIQLVLNKQYQRYYLKYKFQNQNILQNYYSDIPWYCLQNLLKKGGQLQVTQKQQLKFINQKIIQSQKNILRYLIKHIGANILSGKSVLNFSLPVDIFQSRSLLERSAASLGKSPDYLLRCSQSEPLQQIMNLTAFLASVPTLQLVMQKPFNPVLGQTFQCYLKGIPLCYQQISHHPPISSYYMECPDFKLYGNLIAFANIGLNSGIGGNLGVMHVIFKNGYHYQCYFPPSQISGLIYGDRKFRSYGRGYVIEKKQKIFSEFSIQNPKKGIYQNKDKLKTGSIIGGIFKVNSKFINLFESFDNNLKNFVGISKDHIVQKLISINGLWFDKIYMNEILITQNIRAYPVQYANISLPSDSNFRLDVLYHKQNNLQQSQRQKQTLENIQRQNRKLREKFDKINKK